MFLTCAWCNASAFFVGFTLSSYCRTYFKFERDRSVILISNARRWCCAIVYQIYLKTMFSLQSAIECVEVDVLRTVEENVTVLANVVSA